MIDGNDVYVPNRSGLSFHDIFSLHSYGRGRVVGGGGGGMGGGSVLGLSIDSSNS